ncbi:M50 family metallopeptidase [Devriesea agamarum]|uniref:M50 family metallopeptidase n=1 Tax=Devriesea agamarum TaxID=472569 RepID=UPI00071DADB4|nr:site-2 protease family protein [Devriesea agamarum]
MSGTTLLYIAGIVILALGLGLSIALHEIGHLVPAKRFGVRVTQYMIGFGPTIWSRRRGETEYGVKAIPLGGYIRMIGMYPPHKGDPPDTIREDSTGFFRQMSEDAKAFESEQYGPEDQHRTFVALPVWKKLMVMLGGPCMNLLLSIIFFTVVVSGLGLPALTTKVSSVSRCVVAADAPAGTNCEGKPAAPAFAAGVRPGDKIVSLAGKPMSSWQDVSTTARALPPAPVPMVVERDGKELTLSVTPVVDARPVMDSSGRPVKAADGKLLTEKVGFLGIAGTPELIARPITEVPQVVWNTFTQTGALVLTLPQRMVDIAQAAFGSGTRDPNGPVGVVGVSRLAGEVVSTEATGFDFADKAQVLLSMLASLNMALFVFNLIPLPPLDGGHVAGALVEGARRMIARWRGRPDPGPVDMSRLLPLTNVVALILIGMSVLLVYADLVRPVTLSG